MTRPAKTARGAAGEKAAALPTDRLTDAVRKLVAATGEWALTSAANKLDLAIDRWTNPTGKGGRELMAGLLSSKAGIAGSVLKKLGTGGGTAKQAGKNAANESTDKQTKLTNIVEAIDVGVPVDMAYNQWTQFTDFPDFTKKVEGVEQESDETLTWHAKVLWSRRSWTSTIVDQTPDERIVWRSTGDKGYVDGAVTFHELAPNLTRILLVLEYHPQGFFERTGNIWRAQGRRARLELKHFQRHVMTRAVLHANEIEGWRGEIQDGQVVERGRTESKDGRSRAAVKGRRSQDGEKKDATAKSTARTRRRANSGNDKAGNDKARNDKAGKSTRRTAARTSRA